MVRIGPHVHDEDPLPAALSTDSSVVQFFLGDPQGWAVPKFPGGDAVCSITSPRPKALRSPTPE